MMTVGQLIEALQEYHPDTEVRMVYQRNYPLQADIADVMPLDTGEDDEDTVYLTEGSAEYGPRGW